MASTDDDYCPMTDILKSSCDHCRHADKQIVPRAPEPLPKPLDDFIVAEFPGVCGVCGEDIIKDDHIASIKEVKSATTGEVVKRIWAHYGCTD